MKNNRGTGKVLDPANDARVGRGAETCRKLQAAYLEWVKRGIYRPSLDMLAGQSGVPGSTIKNHYPRLSLLAAVVADRWPADVLRSLSLPGSFLAVPSKKDAHALAYALLVGERFNNGESKS